MKWCKLLWKFWSEKPEQKLNVSIFWKKTFNSKIKYCLEMSRQNKALQVQLHSSQSFLSFCAPCFLLRKMKTPRRRKLIVFGILLVHKMRVFCVKLLVDEIFYAEIKNNFLQNYVQCKATSNSFIAVVEKAWTLLGQASCGVVLVDAAVSFRKVITVFLEVKLRRGSALGNWNCMVQKSRW